MGKPFGFLLTYFYGVFGRIKKREKISDDMQDIAENQKDQCSHCDNPAHNLESLKKIDSLFIIAGILYGIAIRFLNWTATRFHDWL